MERNIRGFPDRSGPREFTTVPTDASELTDACFVWCLYAAVRRSHRIYFIAE
jgi:hypothetical protein